MLEESGFEVHYASLSFSEAGAFRSVDNWLDESVAVVTPNALMNSTGDVPERTLAIWLAANEKSGIVYTFPRSGVEPLIRGYRALITHLGVDAIILVDGGTDILLRGDEEYLGTPEEDAASLAAVSEMHDVPVRIVVSIGFGIDAYHGVSHVHVLENIAALDSMGAYLGAFSVPSRSRAARLYREAVDHAATNSKRPSLVNGQISAALGGKSGNVPIAGRGRASELFVNPLMAMYFCFDLAGLAARNLYLAELRGTVGVADVAARIGRSRSGVALRPSRVFPH